MINAFADIHGNLGYAIHARSFFSALNKILPLCLVPKGGKLPEVLDESLIQMIQRITEIDLSQPAINLDYGIDLCRFQGHPQIAYTVFETTKLPTTTHQILKQMPIIWVPTDWGRDVLAQHEGISKERIIVIPEGVDADTFSPRAIPIPQIHSLGGFKFLAVGKWEGRKGVKELLYAFDQAFSPSEDVWMVVHFQSKVLALQGLDVKAEIDALGLKNRGRVVIQEEVLSTGMDMARLYRSCDCLVSASKAEGWGLPLIEAMSCGLPVLAPEYSGPTAYLNSDNSFLYPVTELEPAYCPVFFPNKGQHGDWARIDVKVLAQKMREVVASPEDCEAIGAKARDSIEKQWTWDHAAQTAAAFLQN